MVRLPELPCALLILYVMQLTALLAGNSLRWCVYVQVVVGSALGVLAMVAATATLIRPAQAAGVRLLGILGTLCFAVLDPQFGAALEPDDYDVSFPLPAFLPTFVLNSILALPKRTALIEGSLLNAVCLVFSLASFRSALPGLYAAIFEVGVLIQSLRSSSPSAKLTTVTDLNVSKHTSNEKEEEVVGSELEAVLQRLHQLHANAQEAVNVAISSDDLQRARNSEAMLGDLLQRLTTKNLYALSTERLPKRMSIEEKTYLEENYLPPAVPIVRRRDRLRSLVDPTKYSLSELEPLLSQAGRQWNFDTDFLTNCSSGHPVSTLGDYLFGTLLLNKRLQLDSDLVQRFFEILEQGYLPNAYHNFTHAADVMFSVMFLCKNSGLFYYSSDLEVASCVVATLGHDVGHLGFNNRFLVNSRHELATQCKLHIDNDLSVLEMMHSYKTFQIAEETHAFDSLPIETWTLFRRQVVEMILATDMAKHFELLAQFRVAVSGPKFEDQAVRFSLYKMLLKCADIGHAAKRTELHERWSMRVIEEFFKQGDAEKERNLAVSMFCDRENTDVGKVRTMQSQRGFLENLALPLFETVAATLRCEVIETTCVQQIRSNMVFWERRTKKRASTVQSSQVVLALQRDHLSASGLLADHQSSL